MADDRHLLAALADLADHLDWPADPADQADLTTRALDEIHAVRAPGLGWRWSPVNGHRSESARLSRTRARLGSSRRSGPRWVLAAVMVVAVVGASVVPAAREAVADLLGVGGIRITRDDGGGSRGIGGRLDLGRPVGLEEAARLSPGPLPRPEGLSAPTAVFAGQPPGGVTLVWAPDDRLPEVLDHDVGLIVTAFPGRMGSPEVAIEKRGRDGGTTQPLTVDGAPAYWLSGAPHEIAYVDDEGRPREDTVRLSGNALVWERDGVTYRLESALSRSEAVQLAESLPPGG